MPLHYFVDHHHRVVVVKPRGKVNVADLFRYEQTISSRSDITGYRALVDMRDTDDIAQPSNNQIHQLARAFARSDGSSPAPRLALIARKDYVFGLARMFKSYSEAEGVNENSVGVFRTLDDAAEFLQLPANLFSHDFAESGEGGAALPGTPPPASTAERRDALRLKRRLQIEISGEDAAGTSFSEQAVTVDLSPGGCCFEFLRPLRLDALIVIRLIDDGSGLSPADRDQVFKVSWIEQGEHGWVIGAVTLEDRTPWAMFFQDE